jgi:hypothetical protein
MAKNNNELDKLKENFEGSAAQRAGLTFNDYVKLVQAKPTTPKVTVSRGSNKPKQVGDQNQREAYNSVRGTINGRSNSKVSKADVKKGFKAVKDAKAAGVDALGTEMGLADSIKKRKQQRAGGKGK